jgi:hypothetical protein
MQLHPGWVWDDEYYTLIFAIAARLQRDYNTIAIPPQNVPSFAEFAPCDCYKIEPKHRCIPVTLVGNRVGYSLVFSITAQEVTVICYYFAVLFAQLETPAVVGPYSVHSVLALLGVLRRSCSTGMRCVPCCATTRGLHAVAPNLLPPSLLTIIATRRFRFASCI